MSIKFSNVFYTYSPKTPFAFEALNDVSLKIEKGSFTALIGKTGSGKSTLIQHLNGLLYPSSGEVEVEDFIISKNKKRRTKKIKALRQLVGIVFQFPEYQLFEESVEKDVAFGPRNFGVKKEEALKIAHEALSYVGLDESFYTRSPFELSGGERRRVAIAGILALSPDILVLDEPTVGLDPRGAKEMMSLFKKLHQEGKTIILVTHDMNLVFNYATNVILLDEGRLILQSTPLELFQDEEKLASLEVPLLYEFMHLLKLEGLELDYSKVNSLETLINELIRAKGLKT
ncbi:MAG: energy-coupling factor transporter ATPase [Erysipelotrichia bacterium]|jgi:energy-coupling factor transport system ATP-binding protein|nr:energy-coupling factor transporter ATPase [Erysipelotrichia bacterium]